MTLLWTPLSSLACFAAFAAALAGVVWAWLWGPATAAARRRRRVTGTPFPAAWRHVLRRRMPAFARMPADLQLRMKRHVQIMLAETPVIGCAGLVVTDEMRVLIAAQAALLVLHRGVDAFAELRQVLLYPAAFLVDRVTEGGAGLRHESRRALSGESWQQGQVLLSWDDVVAGAADPDDGRNVVIHEFAHQLDQASGRANGAPWLGRRERYASWSAVLGAEYAALQDRLRRGEHGLIDAYGASDPAEFFAVASEHFFEQAAALCAAHPALYGELSRYYRVDPASWQPAAAQGSKWRPGP